jgi:hypothetical protein
MLALLLLLVTPLAPFAQDGLYAPVRPEDTALVRVVHAAPDSLAPVTIDVGTTRFAEVSAGFGTPFRPVRPGVYVVMAYGHREALTAANGTFHTVLVSPAGITVVADTYHDDPLRAQLVLYNLTGQPVRLDAVEPEARLIDSVLPGESGTRVINAIPVRLAVTPVEGADGDRDRYDVTLELTRGSSYSLVVSDGPNGVTGFTVLARVEGGPAE